MHYHIYYVHICLNLPEKLGMEIFGLSRAVTLDLTFTLGNKYADSLKVGEKLFSA